MDFTCNISPSPRNSRVASTYSTTRTDRSYSEEGWRTPGERCNCAGRNCSSARTCVCKKNGWKCHRACDCDELTPCMNKPQSLRDTSSQSSFYRTNQRKPLTLKNVFNALREVPDWRSVGLQLEVSTYYMDTLEGLPLTPDNRKERAIRSWLDNDPNPSWGKLADGLEMMDYKRLACQIRTYEEGDLYEQPAFPVADEVTSSMSGKRSRSNAKEEINPNVLMVKFSVIGECHDVHTGDPVVCQKKGCTAILNHLSKMTEKPESVWVCEFCGTKNEAVIIPEEVPQSEEVLFIGCAPGPAANADAKGGLVVFCVDTSGSMGVTTEVPGRFELRGHDHLKELQQMYGVIGEDILPPENMTYVSRLQSVQAAVDQQLQAIAQNNSAQRVALVTFGDEVVVIGDGKSEDVVIAGDRLCSYNALVKCSAELPVPSPIRETRGVLKEKLFGIVPDGQTALGPALVISIQIAAQALGSKVIICTDGLANRGVGNLEGQSDVRAFYKKMGEEARDKSVTVSVITIKGTTCNLFDLGQVGQVTGGQVTIKDPVNIAQEFANMLVNPFIATGVNVKIVLHTGLFIKSDDSQESILKVSVGNVTESSELIHEFGMKESFFLQYIQPFYAQEEGSISSVGESVHLPPPNITDGKPHVPIQLQIKYTTPTGQQYLLVITKSQPIAPDQHTAMQGMDMQIMGCHFVRKVAELGTEGKFEEAQESAAQFQRMLADHHYTSSKERRICQQLDDIMSPLQSAFENLTPSARQSGKPDVTDESSLELYQAAQLTTPLFDTFNIDKDDGEESESRID